MLRQIVRTTCCQTLLEIECVFSWWSEKPAVIERGDRGVHILFLGHNV